ncbi:hypothetical protein [Actinomadura decatromicini]|uniref:Uncharacterized protein n=1 Tax=Actinomadura decatromicini TaxID=2604572 RepID=A0A5D3F6E7_9ACTN|nr:hypothetical protein [Actinomadura decatromicini]TYK43240.1 hypothetical protein FXF68_39170 [Actinomadura decatromicini]
MALARPKDWVPNRALQDSRLAWEAARPELSRRATPWWTVPLRILSAGATANALSRSRTRGDTVGDARKISNEAVSGRLATFAVPVDVVTDRLSPAELKLLRAEGTLPDWFFDAVEEERRARRKRRS